jgi:hypothetical protein
MQKYTQLTYEQRYHIYLLNKQGHNQTYFLYSLNHTGLMQGSQVVKVAALVLHSQFLNISVSKHTQVNVF